MCGLYFLRLNGRPKEGRPPCIFHAARLLHQLCNVLPLHLLLFHSHMPLLLTKSIGIKKEWRSLSSCEIYAPSFIADVYIGYISRIIKF